MTQLAQETESLIPIIEKCCIRTSSFAIGRECGSSAKQLGMEAKPHLFLDPLTRTDAGGREIELVKAAQAGSTDAFEELQKLHWNRLHKTVLSITRNREDAEDVLQDTFLKAYLALGTFEGRSKFGSWLTRIAINSALMFIRKQHVRPEVFIGQSSSSEDDTLSFDIRDSALNPEQIYDQHQRCLRVLRALRRLDPKLQEPIRIRFRALRECSIKDIAEALDVSQATAKTRLHRARRRLRRSLALADSKHLSLGSYELIAMSKQIEIVSRGS